MNQIVTANLSDIERLNRNLKAYIAVRHKKTVSEILNEKGNRLRIQLFKGFWAQRWAKGNKGGAFRLLHSLVAQGKGVLVRLMRLVQPWASMVPKVDKRGRKLSLWQKLVAQEMLRRQAGVGVLGVSFLARRWATKNNEKFLVTNRTKGLGLAATFEKFGNYFIITGFTPGLARIASKYGILNKAIREMSYDMEDYLLRKLGPQFLEALHA